VDIVPENESVSIVKTADILPATSSSTGSVKIYATNSPTANIIVTLNVYNNTSQSVSYNSEWVRPGDWLSMPTIGTQEFIGLLAITDDESNHIALLCAGAYTVDWGDGVAENVATGVKAQHTYTYSSISGTPTTRGYKQVLVRVTPQAGQNLTNVTLQRQHTLVQKGYATSWLDISVNGSNITTFSLGGNTVKLSMCERVVIGAIGTITNFTNFFWQCYSLQSVNVFNTASGTNFTYMFRDCYMLQAVPLLNVASGTNFTGMFYNCIALKSVPALNAVSGTNFSQMFVQCRSLQNISLINTAAAVDMTSMFGNCNSLITIPLLNTALVKYFGSMFSSCSSLQTIPLINTAEGLDFSYMFDVCNSLVSIPLLNTIKVTDFTRVFYACYTLQQLPNLNTAAGTSFTNIFAGTVYSLGKGAFQGTRYAINYANMCLSQSAIVDIFNGLGTAVGAQTITVTNNPGRAALTAPEIAIATGKGWTVV
jgi:hypothetical protein